MRHLIATLLLLATCGGNDDPYTWGDASDEIALAYCEGLDACTFEVDVDLCVDHTAWHLCEADRSCDAQVDGDAFALALEECRAAVDAGAVEFAEAGGDATVCNAILFGSLPHACDPLFEFRP